MNSSEERDWGITYITNAGDIHTEWGYTHSPINAVSSEGEYQIGKREWATAYEIVSRPKGEPVSEWKSKDCPW